jgi:hypothetical protein
MPRAAYQRRQVAFRVATSIVRAEKAWRTAPSWAMRAQKMVVREVNQVERLEGGGQLLRQAGRVAAAAAEHAQRAGVGPPVCPHQFR